MRSADTHRFVCRYLPIPGNRYLGANLEGLGKKQGGGNYGITQLNER